MVSNFNTIDTLYSEQLCYVLAVRHKNYVNNLSLFSKLKSSVFLGFKKLSKRYRLIIYYIFSTLIYHVFDAGKLNNGLYFFYSKLPVGLINKLFYRINSWVINKKLRYTKDFDILLNKKGLVSIRFNDGLFLQNYFKGLNIPGRVIPNILENIVIIFNFQVKKIPGDKIYKEDISVYLRRFFL
jgi:hypothetical protein